MTRRALRFLGGHGEDLRIPAQALVDAVGALLEGAERAVRLVVEGESARSDARPAWLAAACRVEVTGLAAGPAVITLEAPTLAEALPDRVGHLEEPDPDGPRDLFGTTVLVSGITQYRPTGRPSVMDVEYIGPATATDAMWNYWDEREKASKR